MVSIRAQEDLEPNFSAPFYALVKDLLHYTPELSDFDQSELIPSVPSKFFQKPHIPAISMLVTNVRDEMWTTVGS